MSKPILLSNSCVVTLHFSQFSIISMAHQLLRRWVAASLLAPLSLDFRVTARSFRSAAALEAVERANEEKVPNLVLYNYPSFSGVFSALFARVFHSRLNLPCLVLPFSPVEPFRVEDLRMEGLERCYLLDFLGPPGFAATFSRQYDCDVIAFDHRKSSLSRVSSAENCSEGVKNFLDVEKSSSRAVYEYFSGKLTREEGVRLLNQEDQARVELVLKYIEDEDLRRWSFPETKAFKIGISEWRSRINCITNPDIFEELLEISSVDLISKGDLYISSRWIAASKLLDKVFKVRLGGGFYGECLGVRADGNGHLSDEIGKQLSIKSAAAGLRPIGAVVFKQRNNLKMCLRSTDSATDTSEVAKAYGGGGSPSSSSFMIRMDHYNQWYSVYTSPS